MKISFDSLVLVAIVMVATVMLLGCALTVLVLTGHHHEFIEGFASWVRAL